jgi:hypothetical protein
VVGDLSIATGAIMLFPIMHEANHVVGDWLIAIEGHHVIFHYAYEANPTV